MSHSQKYTIPNLSSLSFIAYSKLMKKIICILIILVISSSLYSKDQEILPIENKIYDYIDYVYILDSKLPPTAVKPYSISQMKVYLNAIDYNSLNKTAKRYYQYISKEINKKTLDIKLDDSSSIDIGAEGGFELYSHSNTEDVKTYRDWVYNQEDRIPLLKLSLKIAINDVFFTSSELQYMQGKYEPSDDPEYYLNNAAFFNAYTDGKGIGSIATATDSFIYNIKTDQYTNSYSTNFPKASKHIDFDTPKRSIFSVGGTNLNFNYSKDKLNWGNSILGNFIFNDHIKNTYMNLKVFSPKFNINNTIAFINTQTHNGEGPDEKVKMFFTHRLEFMPFDFFRFAVSENVMYANDQPILLYFNPSYIYHNINMRGMFNAIASLETEVLLFNKVNWYSQFVLDQARAPNENDSQSAAWGFSSGLNYILPVNDSILSLSLEGLITLPTLYRRDHVDFLTFDRTFVINQSYVVDPTFIGYPDGGDTVAFKIQGNYDKLNKFKALVYYSLTFKGEVDIFTPVHVENDGITLSNNGKPNYGEEVFKNGVYSIKHVVHSSFDYNIFSNDYISISSKTTLSYIYKKTLQSTGVSLVGNYDDIQFSTGLSIKY